MQQLYRYFPPMPTWVNIQSVMIVQPNGKILSQYREMSQRQKTIKLSLVKNQTQRILFNKDDNYKQGHNINSLLQHQQKIPKKQQQHINKHNQTTITSSNSKKHHHKQFLQQITQRVIQSSRKLFRQLYQRQLNKLIFNNNTLVYYRTRYNVIVIIVVKKFSIQTQQIQQLMNKVFNWYYEKCMSMNIQINIPNVRIGQYQEGQFKKLQWEIANQIDQKVARIDVQRNSNKVGGNVVQRAREDVAKQRLQHIGQGISSREEKLREIGQKVFFHQTEHQQPRIQSSIVGINILAKIKNLIIQMFPALTNKQSLPKTRKFKRQLSFMQKSVCVVKELRIRLFLFYFCLIVSLVLGGMVYLGWFRDGED